jgi:hypothetical protein
MASLIRKDISEFAIEKKERKKHLKNNSLDINGL